MEMGRSATETLEMAQRATGREKKVLLTIAGFQEDADSKSSDYRAFALSSLTEGELERANIYALLAISAAISEQ